MRRKIFRDVVYDVYRKKLTSILSNEMGVPADEAWKRSDNYRALFDAYGSPEFQALQDAKRFARSKDAVQFTVKSRDGKPNYRFLAWRKANLPGESLGIMMF